MRRIASYTMAVYQRLDGWRRRLIRPRSLGDRGERLAERYLRRRGMTIIGRQERSGGGELDLIGVDDRTIVFVEVKTRRSVIAGHPLEAVTDEKQARITRAALAYLHRHGLLEYSARFDVVAVLWPEGGPNRHRPEIRHIRNAFEAHGTWQMFV